MYVVAKREVKKAKPPAGYDVSQFPVFAVTVDIAVLTVRDDRLKVLLVRRAEAPFKNAWALPGGFKRPDETLDEAAARELSEETSIQAAAHLVQFGAYGDPGRDPRTNVVTIGYLAVVPNLPNPEAGSDAAEARLFDVVEILDGGLAIAFDHRRIVADSVAMARKRLEETDLALSFVEPSFTVPELRVVFEAIWGTPLEPANFRRSVTAENRYVVPTGSRRTSGTSGGRPPETYTATEEWADGSPVRRQRRR